MATRVDALPLAPGARAPAASTRAIPAIATVPWYIWCAVLALTSSMIGGQWDVSWHRAIGRDTFWTPAHIAIYLCGVLAGISSGYLILHTTFAKSSPLRDASVRIWGFRAPLGAFLMAWGGVAMITSAPFDDWWHSAYGLDVKIVSPPHMVLILGIYAALLGTLVLIAGRINRTTGPARDAARYLALYVCCGAIVLSMFVLMEFTSRTELHNTLPYIALAIPLPIVLAVSAHAPRVPFGATLAAAFYTLFYIGLILVLPLFPAEPKLGPVYHQVTQFLPPPFPVLVIVPAFLLDLLWRHAPGWNQWLKAALSAPIFVASLIAAEWPLASFLMTPAARNKFFGTMYIGFSVPPDSPIARNVFFIRDHTPAEFWTGIAIALAVAFISFRIGFSRAAWLRSIER